MDMMLVHFMDIVLKHFMDMVLVHFMDILLVHIFTLICHTLENDVISHDICLLLLLLFHEEREATHFYSWVTGVPPARLQA